MFFSRKSPLFQLISSSFPVFRIVQIVSGVLLVLFLFVVAAGINRHIVLNTYKGMYQKADELAFSFSAFHQNVSNTILENQPIDIQAATDELNRIKRMAADFQVNELIDSNIKQLLFTNDELIKLLALLQSYTGHGKDIHPAYTSTILIKSAEIENQLQQFRISLQQEIHVVFTSMHTVVIGFLALVIVFGGSILWIFMRYIGTPLSQLFILTGNEHYSMEQLLDSIQQCKQEKSGIDYLEKNIEQLSRIHQEAGLTDEGCGQFCDAFVLLDDIFFCSIIKMNQKQAEKKVIATGQHPANNNSSLNNDKLTESLSSSSRLFKSVEHCLKTKGIESIEITIDDLPKGFSPPENQAESRFFTSAFPLVEDGQELLILAFFSAHKEPLSELSLRNYHILSSVLHYNLQQGRQSADALGIEQYYYGIKGYYAAEIASVTINHINGSLNYTQQLIDVYGNSIENNLVDSLVQKQRKASEHIRILCDRHLFQQNKQISLQNVFSDIERLFTTVFRHELIELRKSEEMQGKISGDERISVLLLLTLMEFARFSLNKPADQPVNTTEKTHKVIRIDQEKSDSDHMLNLIFTLSCQQWNMKFFDINPQFPSLETCQKLMKQNCGEMKLMHHDAGKAELHKIQLILT